MKNLMITLAVLIGMNAYAQNTYPQAMKTALMKWKTVENQTEVKSLANEFQDIADAYPDEWLPLYYKILFQTTQAFHYSNEEALALVPTLEKEWQILQKKTGNTEVEILQGLILTLKVKTNPQVYGAELYGKIPTIYQAVLAEEPNNPRAVYLLAEYQMFQAPYIDEKPQKYCSDLEKSISLFSKEKAKGFEPSWGLERAKITQTQFCK
ncbi:hypothetical protein KRX57_00100 [Weeksellaceae bacterium TAE3-ERU29]|nr:hypothetical protein [Weeksellaceae bacterium TAE3-ERU29]